MLKSPPTKAITTRKVNNRNYQLGTYEKRIEE